MEILFILVLCGLPIFYVMYFVYVGVIRDIVVGLWCILHGWEPVVERGQWGWDTTIRYYGIDDKGERHYWYGDERFRIDF